jgi:hypothetical protein
MEEKMLPARDKLEVLVLYRSVLQAKGFEDEEIVALAYVHAFGVVEDPSRKDGTIYTKFDNYYYKSLLTGKDLPL